MVDFRPRLALLDVSAPSAHTRETSQNPAQRDQRHALRQAPPAQTPSPPPPALLINAERL